MKKLSLLQSTLAFAFAIGVNFLLQIVFSLVLSLQGVDRDLTQYIFMICLQACNLFIVVYMTKNKAQEPNFAVLSPRISNLWKVGLLTIFTLVGCYICTLFVTEVVEKTGAQAGQINIDGGYLVLAIISTCVFAPIGEEGIYRYLLLSGLKENFRPRLA